MLFDCFVLKGVFSSPAELVPFQVDLPLHPGEDFNRYYARNARIILREYLVRGLEPVYQPYDEVRVICKEAGDEPFHTAKHYQMLAYFSEASNLGAVDEEFFPVIGYGVEVKNGPSELSNREQRLTTELLLQLGFRNPYEPVFTPPGKRVAGYAISRERIYREAAREWAAFLPSGTRPVIRNLQTFGELYDFHKGMTGEALEYPER